MLIEYVSNVNQKFPKDAIVRIFDFTMRESKDFCRSMMRIWETGEPLDMATLNFAKEINCKLRFAVDDRDQGVRKSSDGNFVCFLTKKSYWEMYRLIESYNEKEGELAHQWLYNLNTDIDLLYSRTGLW